MNDLNASLRRFLEDLRSGADRRSWDERRSDERRSDPSFVEHDRRTQDDRRQGERRSQPDRRSGQYYAFTERETMEVEAMFADPRALVACPRCGGRLLLTIPDVGLGTDVICLKCRGRLRLFPRRRSDPEGDRP